MENGEIIFDVRLGLSLSRKVCSKDCSSKRDACFLDIVNGNRSFGWINLRLECHNTSITVSAETCFVKNSFFFSPMILTHRESKSMVRNLTFTHNGGVLLACNEHGCIFVWTC